MSSGIFYSIMSAILPFNLAPTAAPDVATSYWRCCCFAAGYLTDGAATLSAMAGLVGATSVVTIPFSVPIPNRVYLLLLPSGVVVLTNGTTHPAQYVTSAVGAATAVDIWGDGSVNGQLLGAAVVIDSVIHPMLEALSPPRVLYIGHSLGGAVSQLLAQRPQTWPVVGAWSAGQLRVGDGTWAAGYRLASERYTTPGDPVPMLPPAFSPLVDLTLFPLWPIPLTSYRHVGTRRHVLLDGDVLTLPEEPSWAEGSAYLLSAISDETGWVGAHSTLTYAGRLRQGIPVPWLGSSPQWPLIGQLDALVAPLLPAGEFPDERNTRKSASPRGGTGSQYGTEGICL
jgi:hypothetical protein